MFMPEARTPIWLCTTPTDMRKSFTGLSAQVRRLLGENPTSGELFVFVNRRGTQMKVLYFDRTGYCIWSKRLEQGQFNVRDEGQTKRLVNWTQLQLLLEGIEIKQYRQFKRYQSPPQAGARV